MSSQQNGLSTEVIEGTFDLARQGRTGPLGEMIDAGVPINTRNARGDTLLIVATYAEHSDTVRDLIDRGADLNAANAMGQTAITCAVFRKNEPLLRMLLDAGADQNVGAHTAVAVADQFGLADMRAVLEEYAQ